MTPTESRAQLIGQLKVSQEELIALLSQVAGQQDWRPAPQMWSFRDHAAHLATTDQEAYWERVTRIAAGEQPHFDWYFNTDRDFSQHDLADSLRAWALNRQRILDFVQALPDAKLALTGTHRTFGVITVLDVLRGMLDHDREHLAELKGYVARVLAL